MLEQALPSVTVRPLEDPLDSLEIDTAHRASENRLTLTIAAGPPHRHDAA